MSTLKIGDRVVRGDDSTGEVVGFRHDGARRYVLVHWDDAFLNDCGDDEDPDDAWGEYEES